MKSNFTIDWDNCVILMARVDNTDTISVWSAKKGQDKSSIKRIECNSDIEILRAVNYCAMQLQEQGIKDVKKTK